MSEDKMLEVFYKKYGALKDYGGDGAFYYAMLGAFAVAWRERETQEDIAELLNRHEENSRNRKLLQMVMCTFGISDPIDIVKKIDSVCANNFKMETRLMYARKALANYQAYRDMNTLNFQLEKADSYIHELAAALLEDK